MGVINAAKAIGMKKPIIIRLKGTNVEEAKRLIEVSSFTGILGHTLGRLILILLFLNLYCMFSFPLCQGSGFKMIVTDDLEDAASKAVHIASIVKSAEEVNLQVQFVN